MKIFVNKKSLETLERLMPSCSRRMIHYALNFDSKTVNASRVRCYAVNNVSGTVVYNELKINN